MMVVRKRPHVVEPCRKPMSVAMCIFAALTDSQVFYTQPTVYHPDYSFDIASRDGHPEIYTYCIRLEGRDLFSVP